MIATTKQILISNIFNSIAPSISFLSCFQIYRNLFFNRLYVFWIGPNNMHGFALIHSHNFNYHKLHPIFLFSHHNLLIPPLALYSTIYKKMQIMRTMRTSQPGSIAPPMTTPSTRAACAPGMGSESGHRPAVERRQPLLVMRMNVSVILSK